MRRSTILAAAFTALSALVFCPEVHVASVNAAEPNLWQYLYPGTKTVIGVDWQRARSSPTGKMIARQLSQSSDLKVGGKGMEILDQIDRLLISTSGRQALPGEMPPVVVAMQGRLTKELIQKLAPKGTAVEKFKGADLFVPLNAKVDEPLLALVNEQFAVMGDRQTIAVILDAQGASPADQETLAKAMQMAAECEIFVVSRESLSDAAGGAAEGPAAMKQLQDIQSVDLGITLAKGLGLRGAITSKDPASAPGLAMMAQLFATMASSDQKQPNSEMSKIARSLNVKTEGSTVHLSLDIPLAQLEKGVVQMRASAKDIGSKSLESFIGLKPQPGAIPGLRPAVSPEIAAAEVAKASAPPRPPAPPAAPVKKTIRIVGLDSGDKEINYKSGGGL